MRLALVHPSYFSIAALLLAGVCLLFLLGVAALARHKKSAARNVSLVGRAARVVGGLRPEGFVLVDGELWPARLRSGVGLEGGRVRVVGARGHFLEVEPISDH